MNRTALVPLGWDDALDRAVLDAGWIDAAAGRVARIDRGWATVWLGDDQSVRLSTTGGAAADGAVAVGDWVVVDDSGERAAAVLPRHSALTRRAPDGSAAAQVLGANVDVVALCHALPAAPNPRRLERELVVGFDSGATPVVLLTKADRSDDPEAVRAAVAAIDPAVAVVTVSARSGEGLAALLALTSDHRTLALLGSSGVGKSTLVNVLVGTDVQRTGALRAGDGKGRHTTTAAELVRLPSGGLLLDTPGLRAVALWSDGSGLAQAFADVVAVAEGCWFANCTHSHEPDCAVREAVAEGRLDAARVTSWQHLSAELATLKEERAVRERVARRGRPRDP